jgi:hypothetical protein
VTKPDRHGLSNPPREWAPRIWQGCSAYAWWRLVIHNRFAISPKYWPIALVLGHSTLMNSILGWIKEGITRGEPAKTPLQSDPVFILGHWRTGTTLLHELLIQDPAHHYPTTMQCMSPNHATVTEPVFRRLLNWLLPSRRPMDNMAAGWNLPQEDEFALCMLGLPSPYLSIAFPNHAPMDEAAYELDDLGPKGQQRWKAGFLGFLREISWKDQRRLVLKSPTHTFRVKHLLQMFPNAKFIHLYRDPYVVYPSTINLWKTLQLTHGMQVPRFEGLEHQVFETFLRMHKALDAARPLFAPHQFVEIRYEDLVADPAAQLEGIYRQLNLGDFETVRPHVEGYLEKSKSYKTNQYKPLGAELVSDINRRWGHLIRKQGYPVRGTQAQPLQAS